MKLRTWKDGNRISKKINKFLPNGNRIKEENRNENLLPEGIWRYYDDNGNLSRIEEYKKGLPDGYWYYYEYSTNEPQIKRMEEYEKGIIVESKIID